MGTKIVLGIIPANAAQTAINNLVEADYDERDISLVMKDVKSARRIIDEGGPLAGVDSGNITDRLAALKVATSYRQRYFVALEKGSALLAVRCPNDNVDATKGMFADYKATVITVI